MISCKKGQNLQSGPKSKKSLVRRGGGKKKNEIMAEDRETLWKGWDVKANLLPHASVSSCDTI